MSEIKGRTADRKSATISLEKGVISYSVKPGFLGGKDQKESVALGKVKSIETGTGQKPYRDAQFVHINHDLGFIEFYSVHKQPLVDMVSEVNRFLDERDRELAESEATFISAKEAHMALIIMNLDLIDSLMKLVILLAGSVEWGRVEEALAQVERISVDRESLQGLRASSISTRMLRNSVERRLPWAIKQEIHDSVSVLSQEAFERSMQLVSWFPSDLHKLFVDVSMTSWNYQLAPVTGIEPVDEAKDAQILINSLHRAVVDYSDEESIEIPVIGKLEPHQLRARLYLWCEHLLDASFSPDKE